MMDKNPIGVNVVRCHYCEAVKLVNESGSVIEPSPDDPWVRGRRIALVQCSGCGKGLVTEQQDDLFSDNWMEMHCIWPTRRKELSSAVPENLRREHEEAQRCLEARLFTAAGVMVRRTLEGFCVDQGVKEKTLAANLRELERQARLDPTLVTWSDALRILGNQGAHYGEQLNREDAIDAVAFCEALLDYTYVLKSKFNDFEGRRKKGPSASN